MDDYVTVREAVILLGLGRSAILKRIREGKLPARLVPTGRAGNPHMLIPRSAIEEAQSEREEYVTISQAAEITGERRYNLQYACETGRIATRRGSRGEYMILLADIQSGRYKDNPPRPRQPPGPPVDLEDVRGDYEVSHGAPVDEEKYLRWDRARWQTSHYRYLPDGRVAIDANRI